MTRRAKPKPKPATQWPVYSRMGFQPPNFDWVAILSPITIGRARFRRDGIYEHPTEATFRLTGYPKQTAAGAWWSFGLQLRQAMMDAGATELVWFEKPNERNIGDGIAVTATFDVVSQ